MSNEKPLVEIYGRSTPACPFCQRAVQWAEKQGLEYTYYDYAKGEWTKEYVSERAGVPISSVPQIFVNGRYVGGFDDFYADSVKFSPEEYEL